MYRVRVQLPPAQPGTGFAIDHQFAALALIAVGLTAISVAAVNWTSFGGMVAVWPTFALAIVAILRGPQGRVWRMGVCAGFLTAIIISGLYMGGSLRGVLIIASINLFELGLALFLLFRLRLAGQDLTQPRALFGFLACAAIVAPGVAGAMAAPLLGTFTGQSAFSSWLDYWAADALGVILIAPFGMIVTRAHLGRLRTRADLVAAAALACGVTLACVILIHDTGRLALLAPLAVLATLRFGAMGSAISVLWATILAIGLNLVGLGTVSMADPEFRHALFLLQIGLAVLPLATLPIAAVLAERDRALRAATAAERARAAFLTNMSHEIRTPLNGVIGMAELLSRSVHEPRDREIAGTIRESGQALERMLSDVLDLARMESGEALLDDAVFSLGRLTNILAQETRAKLAGRPVTLVLEIGEGLQGLRRGPEMCLRQLLDNLMDNAAKVTEAGTITLSLRAEAGTLVRFTVRDTGPGFEPAVADGLFAAFHQADGSLTRRIGGAGIGLAIVRHLVEDMGGTIRCLSQPGQGATFEVMVPLAHDVAAVSAPGPAPAPAPVMAADGEDRAPRVLLAEDNPCNRRVVELILSQTDVELITVENGAEAVAAFSAFLFDAVLMDVQMPVMDGLTATRAIRRLERERGRAPVPILMLTANALPEHRAASDAAGADAHLCKPITAPALLHALNQALTGRSAQADAA